MSAYFRALLRLYPASFRAEYGDEMAAVFAARSRAGTLPARLALGAAALLDALRSAAAIHGEILRQDLRYAARSFRRSPGFVATAVLVIGLGVGANTAAFSVADHVLLRPPPYPDPERLVKVWARVRAYTRTEVSPATYRDWKSAATSFEALGAYRLTELNLVGAGAPERLEALALTSDVFRVLRARPALGRLLTADDDEPGEGRAVLSYGSWRQRFGGDRRILGSRITLDGRPYTIVGVLPEEFHFPRPTVAIYTPLQFGPDAYEERNDNYLQVLGRLAPEATLDGARTELETTLARLSAQYPGEYDDYGVTAYLLGDELAERARLLILALCGATLCTLLIACANLAGLLLARATARRRELAVRTALGAGQERLSRQLVTESALLAAGGGALGMAVAAMLLPLLARLVPDALPAAGVPALDLRVLAVAALLTGLTGLAFGVGPALRAGRGEGLAGLRDDVRGGGGRPRLRAALVVGQVTASVLLLATAGLLLRALWRIQSVDPGFEPAGVITLRTALSTPGYLHTSARVSFYDRVVAEVEALPGVRAAGFASFLPMAMGGGIWPVEVPGEEETPKQERMASLRFVTPGYFDALGIPTRAGRRLDRSDTEDRPRVAVVSEGFASRYWPGEDPIGRRFTFALEERTVVGIVGEVRVRGPEQRSEPQVYLPAGQVADSAIIGYTPKDLAVRFTGDPTALVASIRRIVERVDPEQPISNVRLMQDIVADQTASRSVQARLLGALAALAVLLAGVGIHGVLSFTVASRLREIGVRRALGAHRRDVLRLVLGQAVTLAAAGVLPGMLLAYAAGRGMRALLASVEPADLPSFGAAIGLCLLAAALGSLAPALRALRADPMLALRAE